MRVIHRKRIEELAKRKNVLPGVVITGILWGVIVCLILFFDPYEGIVLPLFFIFTSIAIFFTVSLVLLKRRRAFLISLVAIALLLLRYFGVGGIMYTILLVALAATIDFYFTRKS